MSEERQYVTNFTFPNGETYYVKDTEAHSKIDAINQNLTGIMTYKGTKATASELPATNNKTGDVWHITENGSEWAWNGTTWEELGNSEASGELVNAVLYDKVQNLTESQKAQARENIGAAAELPSGGTAGDFLRKTSNGVAWQTTLAAESNSFGGGA